MTLCIQAFTEFKGSCDSSTWPGLTAVDQGSLLLSQWESCVPDALGFKLLRLEEVYGAITYYLANQAEIDAYLIRQNEKWAEGRRNAEPLPADLRERLSPRRDSRR
jgi:hypothetical protein